MSNHDPVYQASFDLGVQLMSTLSGRPGLSMDTEKVATLEDDDVSGLKQFLCGLGGQARQLCGHDDGLTTLFEKLASEQEWNPAFDDIAFCVADALGEVTLEEGYENFCKEAGLVRMLAPLAASAVARSVLTASAIGGGIIGTGAFMANRSTAQEAEKNEALQAKIEFYNRLNESLENELSRKGYLKPTDVKRIAQAHRNNAAAEQANAEGDRSRATSPNLLQELM